MKKRWKVVLLTILGIGVVSYFPAKEILGKSDFMTEWGKVLSSRNKETKNNENGNNDANYKMALKGLSSENVISGDDIYEAGSDVLITNQEMDIAKSFYVLQGRSEAEAEKEATKYVEEYNAMYVEAVNNGYDVTEDEVEKYISDLKTAAKDAENSDDVKKVIDQFESEDEYWEYQKIVCQKQLPIQKYVKVLEEEYMAKEGLDENSTEATDSWNSQLDKIKEKAAANQKFKKISSTVTVDKKFDK